MRKSLVIVVILFFHSTLTAQTNLSLVQEINQFDSARKAYLTSENGWLNLAGLLWLSEGRNSFGSDPQNQVVFPGNNLIARAGYFELSNGIVTMVTNKGAGITTNGHIATREVIFHPDSTRLPVSAAGTLKWTIKRSDDKYGIRLRDIKHPAVTGFAGIERYPVDSGWIVKAYLDTKNLSGGVPITNVLGQTMMHSSPGKLIFSISGKTYSFDPIWEGDELHIIFGDETSGLTTYAAGRYLYAKKPDANGYTILDFNKAINPPCAFTEFATCPLPPKQNYLPIAITAGEKDYKPGH